MKKQEVLWKQGFSPHSRISQVPVEQIRQELLLVFQKWGLPKVIKSDNGAPFGVPSRDVVPLMSLWLKGWNIQPILNRPRCPQDNAKVERTQGTSSRWAEIQKASDARDLQNRLNSMINEHLDKYQVKRLGFATRSSVFPDLYKKERVLNEDQFNIDASYSLLAEKTLQRKVASGGTVALYCKTFQAHANLKRQFVSIKFNPSKIGWDIFEQNGKHLKFVADERFSKENIILLTVCQ